MGVVSLVDLAIRFGSCTVRESLRTCQKFGPSEPYESRIFDIVEIGVVRADAALSEIGDLRGEIMHLLPNSVWGYECRRPVLGCARCSERRPLRDCALGNHIPRE